MAPPSSEVAVERSSDSLGAPVAEGIEAGLAAEDSGEFTGPQDVVLAKKGPSPMVLVVVGVVVVGLLVAAGLFLF